MANRVEMNPGSAGAFTFRIHNQYGRSELDRGNCSSIAVVWLQKRASRQPELQKKAP